MPARSRTPYSSTPVEPVTSPRFLPWWWVPDAAFAALRVAIALLLLWHGAQEHFGLLVPSGQRWAGPPALFSEGWIAATIELAGGALLMLGLFTRSVSLLLAVLAVVAIAITNETGARWTLSGAELTALYCVVLLAFALIGPGMFSVDAIRGRRRARISGMTVSMSPWIRRQYRRRELNR